MVRCTKLSQHFRVSRSGVRSIKKFKESHTVQNRSGRSRKWKFSQLLKESNADVTKDPRTTTKALVNDLEISSVR